jgi:hypothetical protein
MLTGVLLFAASASLFAQGNSIPTTSAVREQRDAVEALPEKLPDGVKYRYPLLNGLSISVNLFPPVLDLFGKDFCNYEAFATLDLHHRFFPQVSAGLGYCNEESTDLVKYKSEMRPFIKAGLLYNFKYNDMNPDDFWGVLLRFGYAHSEAEVSNLYYTDGYWGEQGPMTISGLSFNSVWMEIGGSIKVQVVKHVSLGWDLTFKPFLHKGSVRQGKPYFVPGYGSTASKMGLTFHLYYDIF